MKHIFPMFILLSFLALGGCSLIHSPQPGDAGKDPLKGTAWVLAKLNGELPVEGTTLTLTFEDGKFGGSAGYNSFGGQYQVSGDQLTTGEIASTLMACMDDGVMAQESLYLAVLGSAQTFTLTGSELRIFSSMGGELIFTRQN